MADPSQVPRFRKCNARDCNRRLPKASLDPHTVCSNCRGKTCQLGDRCEECVGLSEFDFIEYDKYTRRLERDRVRRSSSRSVDFSSPHAPEPNPSPVVVVPNPPSSTQEPSMQDMLRAIHALGERVEALASDRNQLMADVKDPKCHSATAESGKVISAQSVVNSVATEGSSVRACRSPSPGPLASSQAQGRSNVVRLMGSRGLDQRTDVPSMVSGVSRQDRPYHKTREPIFTSSSEGVSRKKPWSKVSRPLKRKSVPSGQVQRPRCSHWDSSDPLLSSDDCSPPKQGKVVPSHTLTPSVTAPVTVDPKWVILQDMQSKLASLMEDYNADKVSVEPSRLSHGDPGRQPPKRSVVRPVDVGVASSRQPVGVVPHPMRSRVDFQPHVDVKQLTDAPGDVQDVRQPSELTCFDAVRQPPQPRVVLTAQPRRSKQSRVDAVRPHAPVVVVDSSQTVQQFQDAASCSATYAPVRADAACQALPTPLLVSHQLSDEELSDEDVADPQPEDHPSDIDEPRAVPPSMDFNPG
ncbi:uncharacterized protein [Palaemon carinicauda]|uniref:uncharacterized protein n=1 Tax=Palaemon carinicauda TaxID=392227 RepID=UPI0035B5C2E5